MKNFFLLANNSAFDKTVENIQNRGNVKLVTSESKAQNLTGLPNYKDRTIFCEFT